MDIATCPTRPRSLMRHATNGLRVFIDTIGAARGSATASTSLKNSFT
jgi:hypothetical protein